MQSPHLKFLLVVRRFTVSTIPTIGQNTSCWQSIICSEADKIPFSARITSIADAYDVLRSKRPYKSEWTHEDASKEIVANAGKQFDPELIEVFKKLGDQFNVAYEELRD